MLADREQREYALRVAMAAIRQALEPLSEGDRRTALLRMETDIVYGHTLGENVTVYVPMWENEEC